MADTFDTILRFTGEGGTVRTSGGGGLSQSVADNRYLKIAGLGSVTQAWDEQLDTLSTLTATQAGYLTAMDQGVATTDNVTFNSILTTTGVTINDTNGYLQSQTFAGGFGGSGVDVSKDAAGDWVATFDKVTIRKSLASYKSEIRKILVRGGSDWWSDGHKVVEVEQTLDGEWTFSDADVTPFSSSEHGFSNVYRCYIPEDVLMSFEVDDLVRAQESDGRNIFTVEGKVLAVETGDADASVNIPRRYFDIQLTPSSDHPTADISFTRIGNTSDVSRQASIYRTASDDGAPYDRMFNGVNSFDSFGTLDTIKVQIGRLDNITDPDFQGLPAGITDLDGTQTNLYAIYTDGGYYKGAIVADHIVAKDGELQDLTVTDLLTINADGSIASSNYSLGSAGFIIEGDGSVEFNDGTFRGSLEDLTIDGPLTMGASGSITNAGSDYLIDADGFSVNAISSYTSAGAYELNSGGSTIGALYALTSASQDAIVLESRLSGWDLLLGSTQNVEIIPALGSYIRLLRLPTSNPGGTGRVWNDGGILKVT